MQDALQRPRAADLAHARARLRHAVEHLEQVPVRTLVLVDRHGIGKASSGYARERWRAPSPSSSSRASSAPPRVGPCQARPHRSGRRHGAGAVTSAVVVKFDDTVRIAGGNAVANTSRRAVLSAAASVAGRVLDAPARPPSPAGGLHRALEHRLGGRSPRAGRARLRGRPGTPAAAAGARAPSPRSLELVLRTLYFLGLLVGAGVGLFGCSPAAPRRAAPAADRRTALRSLVAAFVGGSALAATRRPARASRSCCRQRSWSLWPAQRRPRSRRSTRRCWSPPARVRRADRRSGTLRARPRPRPAAVPRSRPDLAHTLAAAVWVGGLVAALWVLPRAARDVGATRSAARFSSAALVAVCVLAVSGIGRAPTELGPVHELWSTSYGRALLAKTALFAVCSPSARSTARCSSGGRRAHALGRGRDRRCCRDRRGRRRPDAASARVARRPTGGSARRAGCAHHDGLEEARRVLERREPGRRVARAPRAREAPGATVAIAPAAPTRPPIANDRSLRARPAPSMRRILLVRLTTFGDLLLDVIVAARAAARARRRPVGDDHAPGAGGQAANVAAWARALGRRRALRRQARRRRGRRDRRAGAARARRRARRAGRGPDRRRRLARVGRRPHDGVGPRRGDRA